MKEICNILHSICFCCYSTECNVEVTTRGIYSFVRQTEYRLCVPPSPLTVVAENLFDKYIKISKN